MTVHVPVWVKILACCAVLLPVGILDAHDYFVSPSGKDGDPGTLAQPFATFKQAVRVLRAGDTLYLRQGVYREAIYVAHGGTASSPIVFSGYGSETAVLAGSDLVQGTWKPYQGKIWSLDGVSITADLFMDGQELAPARWPAVPPGAPMDQGWAVAGPGTDGMGLADPSLPDLPLTGAGVEIIPGLGWVSYTRTIKDYGAGKLAFSSSVCGATPVYCPRPGNRYFLYGSLALLDSPGQWWQDPSTGRIYLWSPDGLSPAGHQVEAAKRKLVALDNGFSHVEFRKLYTFCGGIKINRCAGCRVLGVDQRYVQHFTEVQGYYAENPTNSLYAGEGCEWAGGSIAGSSGDGLAVSGKGQHVHDMVIHDVCRAGGYAAALALLGRGQVIENNTLYDSGRYLINLGTSSGGAIRHNELHGAGLLTTDVGAIYSYRTDGGGMDIAYNDVHDVAATRGIGIYLDNGDSNYIVHHNIVHDCAWAALELNLPSTCNEVYNNTLWNCGHWVWADGAPHSMTGTVLAANLYEGTSLLVTRKLAPTLLGNQPYVGAPAFPYPPDPAGAPGGPYTADPQAVAEGKDGSARGTPKWW